MLVVLRVSLPDRPGALGQVASRIGAVRGDLLAIDILESGSGRAVDEFVVALDDPRVVDLMVTEVNAVDGVTVEEVRIIDDDRRSPESVVLEAVVELAEVDPSGVVAVLGRAVMHVLDADWCVIVRDEVAIERIGAVPPVGPGQRGWGSSVDPASVIGVDLERSELRVVAGRGGRPIHERERIRVGFLARIADAVIGPST